MTTDPSWKVIAIAEAMNALIEAALAAELQQKQQLLDRPQEMAIDPDNLG